MPARPLAIAATNGFGEAEAFEPGMCPMALLTEIAALATSCIGLQRTDLAWSTVRDRSRAKWELDLARMDLTEAAKLLAPATMRIATGPAHATCLLAILMVDKLLKVFVTRTDAPFEVAA